MRGTRVTMIMGFCLGLGSVFGQGVRIPKYDFSRFVGVIPCGTGGSGSSPSEFCSGAEAGFVLHGLSGEGEIQDPTSSDLTKGGNMVVGFLEGKPFSWPRYSVDFPASKWKWIVLNELSLSDQNHAVLTRWRGAGSALEFVKVQPRLLTVALGEVYVHAKAPLPDGSLLLILKGEGSDAGVNLQDWRLLRLTAAGEVEQAYRRTNRSEIPVGRILERLNNNESVEPVVDSSLACEIVKGRKAPSGGPLIRFVKTQTRVQYTKSGPYESPLGKDEETLDIWKKIKSGY